MNTRAQAAKYLAAIALLFTFLVGISLYLRMDKEAELNEDLAATFARSYFKAILATRMWNAERGGVYAPVREDMQPNPHLEDPLRDVTTTGGLQLTKVNPAYMTRMIAEILARSGDLKIHVTSMKPLRPENAADAWESAALSSFEKGKREYYGIVGEGESAVFRYMAPLLTGKPCLACHAKQGYRVDDVRGGIGVAFSYAPFYRDTQASNRRNAMHHAFFFLAGLAIIAVLGRRLLKSIGDLEESILRIKRLEGILPICSKCKKIRKEEGEARDQKAWIPLESYIHDRTDAHFSHGLCPECCRELYPGVEL